MPKINYLTVFAFLLVFSACSPLKTVIKPANPHDAYMESLKETGLHLVGIGRDWKKAGDKALEEALQVTIPYKESIYFFNHKTDAFSCRFEAPQGRKIYIQAYLESRDSALFFMEVFRLRMGEPELVTYASDRDRHYIRYKVQHHGQYVLRIQPELLRGGRLTVSITTEEAPLLFPVAGKSTKAIGSFYGAPRDQGKRKHEGVDIFAPKGTPVLAAADGYVTRTGSNNLGGKVIWLRDHTTGHELYYAHLDEQLVKPGKTVKKGDVLGKVGNTGNAKSTPPHLHFGIYTNGKGTVDPLPYLDESKGTAPEIQGDVKLLGQLGRVIQAGKIMQLPDPKEPSSLKVDKDTPVMLTGATGLWYRILTPVGQQGFIEKDRLEILAKPVMTKQVLKPLQLIDTPGAYSIAVDTLEPDTIDIYGLYRGYYLLAYKDSWAWTEAF